MAPPLKSEEQLINDELIIDKSLFSSVYKAPPKYIAYEFLKAQFSKRKIDDAPRKIIPPLEMKEKRPSKEELIISR